MIRKLLLGVIACAMSLGAYAQWGEASKIEKSYVISLGPKVGFNYSLPSAAKNFEGAHMDLSGKPGFDVSLAANAHFGRRKLTSPAGTGWFGLQVEAGYSMRQICSEYGLSKENITMHCWQIPVLAQLYVLPELCIEVGPTFTGAFSTSPEEYQGPVTINTGKIKATDVMLTMGLGYKTRSGFTVSARYNLGNSDMSKSLQSKVSTISVGIGWLFDVVK